MKTIIYKALILFSAVLVMVGCKSDDMEYHDPNVTPVDNLYAPVDNQNLQLSSQQGASFRFQWSQSHAQDGQLVAYEVVFYKESDLQNPVYRLASDNNGKELYANISHVDINRASSAAGIATGETGTIYWSVVSWRGISSAVCAQKNKLVVTRLEGFEVIPDNVYITGEATENGADLSKAILMQNLGDGKFEMYTELDNQGTYTFVDRTSGEPEIYYIDATGKLADADNGEATTVDTKGIYRITLDFSNKGTTMTRITKMGLWFCPSNNVIINMEYVGLGVWAGTGNVEFKQEDWGRDERYKFQLETDKGTRQIGTLNGTDSRPSSNSPASYYYVKLLDNVTQWDDKWKFAGEMDNSSVTVTLYMQGGASYTHTVKKN